MVVAYDLEGQCEYTLNIFKCEDDAINECCAWQKRHRQRWNGINPYHLYIRRIQMDRPGDGAVASNMTLMIDADWT